jgi:hypothetical protein
VVVFVVEVVEIGSEEIVRVLEVPIEEAGPVEVAYMMIGRFVVGWVGIVDLGEIGVADKIEHMKDDEMNHLVVS